jgi:cytochrome c-type biogenesis protein
MIALGVAMASGRFDASTFHVRLPRRRRSGTGYFLFGVGYAVAAAGCTAPLFAALAGVALAGGPATALPVFGAYAAGMVLLVVGVTGLAAVGRDAVLRRASRYTGAVQRLAGVALAIAGVAQIYLFLFRFGGLAILGLA